MPDNSCEYCGDVITTVNYKLERCERESGACDKCLTHQRESVESERIGRLQRESGVKPGRTFESFTPKTPGQSAALAAAQGERSLWLWGNPGRGKSHLANAIVNANLEKEMCNVWLVADLMGRLRTESMTGDPEPIIAVLRYVGILVLDDLGVERPTPLVLECLYRIIDTRADEGLRTIVTSNAKPSVLATTLGARIHSRLLGMCEVINIDGPDGRL